MGIALNPEEKPNYGSRLGFGKQQRSPGTAPWSSSGIMGQQNAEHNPTYHYKSSVTSVESPIIPGYEKTLR